MWVDTTLHNYLNQPDRNYVLVELIDVSAEMAAQEALQEREELLRRLTEAMPDGLLQLDTERQRRLPQRPPAGDPARRARSSRCGGRVAGTSGLETPDASARSLGSCWQPLTRGGHGSFETALGACSTRAPTRTSRSTSRSRSGDWRRALMSIRACCAQTARSAARSPRCSTSPTAPARASELEKRATFDALTGCHNRSSILAALQRELEREDSASTGVVYVDLDDFKSVNDTLGHAAGDELLVLVAERLKDASRDDDDDRAPRRRRVPRAAAGHPRTRGRDAAWRGDLRFAAHQRRGLAGDRRAARERRRRLHRRDASPPRSLSGAPTRPCTVQGSRAGRAGAGRRIAWLATIRPCTVLSAGRKAAHRRLDLLRTTQKLRAGSR